MQQKIKSLGVGESQSSIQFLNPETPNLSLPTNNSQKIKFFPSQIQKSDTILNSTNTKTQKFHNEQNLNNININHTNNSLNTPLDNENINNQYHTGRWAEEEHQKFIEGILEYGNEWKKVQQIIKTRSSTQARSHAQKFFLRVKKIIKNNGGSFNINEKDKILDNIINNILPNKKGETLTKNQKEKLLSAISSNIKYEGETNERSEEEQQIGLEEENLKFKKETNENNLKFKFHKNSDGVGNLFSNNNIFNQRKNTLGQKRKLSRVDSRDKIFIIQKDISHKPSLDISSQKNNKSENNENIIQNNNIYLNESELNQGNKSFEFNKKNNFWNINNNCSNINHNNNNINDNYENKNNMNGCIINNIINVTNNYMNNKYIYNFCSNDMISNNYNYFPDLNNNDKNDSINCDKNYNCYGFFQCPDKAVYNNEKPFYYGNQFNKAVNNNNSYNYNNNKVNNYKENENYNNNESNPFELNFNNFSNENYNNNENNENEQQISVQEDEFIKLNNNNIEDNIDYN